MSVEMCKICAGGYGLEGCRQGGLTPGLEAHGKDFVLCGAIAALRYRSCNAALRDDRVALRHKRSE
jgi:hypothetical protein